jgi:hypothetical protein
MNVPCFAAGLKIIPEGKATCSFSGDVLILQLVHGISFPRQRAIEATSFIDAQLGLVSGYSSSSWSDTAIRCSKREKSKVP